MIKFIFEPRDLWIGVYVSKRKSCRKGRGWQHKVYVLPLPMIGFQIEWRSWRWR